MKMRHEPTLTPSSHANGSSDKLPFNTTRSPTKPLSLDDDDTSMTTTSTTRTIASRTPSPYTSAPSASSSSAVSSPSGSEDLLSSSPCSMLSGLLTASPTKQQPNADMSMTPIASGSSVENNNKQLYVPAQGSWSDSDDYNESDGQELLRVSDVAAQKSSLPMKEHNSSPVRKSWPSWSIQQTLFPEDEAENVAPSFAGYTKTHQPSGRNRRVYNRSFSDSPTEYTSNVSADSNTRHSWKLSIKQSPADTCRTMVDEAPQPPIRTRRARRSVADANLYNSTGRKTRTVSSSQDSHQQFCLSPYEGEEPQLQQAPHSNSKSKRWKKNSKRGLDLPSLALSSLEERLHSAVVLNGINQPAAETTRASFMQGAARNPIWWTLFCRVRLNTMVWGLVAVGLLSLGRAAMLASNGFDFGSGRVPAHQPQESHPNYFVTGGLRGSLLLAAVGRQPSPSKSNDRTAASTAKDHKQQEASQKKDDKKKKGKTKKAKLPKKEMVLKSKEKLTSNALQTPKMSSVARPPPMEPSDYMIINSFKYDDHDLSMFGSSTSAGNGATHRVLMLHNLPPNGTPEPGSRQVPEFPAEFTDTTQFYDRLDSSDERLRKMEIREPYEKGECVPMQDWQTTFHPSCNGVHELGVEYLGEEATETDVQLFGTKGYWRYAWRLDLRKNTRSGEEAFGDRVVLKTLK
jgi:hypothetical protein